MRKAIISATEPSELPEEFEGWFWLHPTTGELKEIEDGSWILKKTLSFTDHTHSEFNLDHDGGKMEITRLKIENGIITALEYGA